MVVARWNTNSANFYQLTLSSISRVIKIRPVLSPNCHFLRKRTVMPMLLPIKVSSTHNHLHVPPHLSIASVNSMYPIRLLHLIFPVLSVKLHMDIPSNNTSSHLGSGPTRLTLTGLSFTACLHATPIELYSISNGFIFFFPLARLFIVATLLKVRFVLHADLSKTTIILLYITILAAGQVTLLSFLL